MGRRSALSNPRYAPMPNGSICITHRVLLWRYSTTGDGKSQNISWAVNPGLDHFRWLSKMAPLFETYRIRKLELRYETAVTTGISGKFYMYFDSDAKDEPAGSIEDFSQQMGCRSTVLWDRGMRYNVPLSLMHRSTGQKLFVRSNADVPTGDITLYDAGTINTLINPTLLSNPTLADVPIGELWADYTIELHTPNTNKPKAVSTQSSALTVYELSDDYSSDLGISGSANPYAEPGNNVPKVDVNGFGNMSTNGVMVPKSGKYRLVATLDSGGGPGGSSSAYEVECEHNVVVRPDASSPGGIVTQSKSNSTGAGNDQNMAETNGNWILNLLQGEYVQPLQYWGGLVGDALLREGSSWALEFIESLALGEVQATRTERKSLLSVEEYLRRKKSPKTSSSVSSTPSSKASPLGDIEDIASDVRVDKEGRSYVVIRPGTLTRSEVRSYL